jgi:hypothetical protein
MQICYLLAFPDSANAEAPSAEKIKGFKDAPYFQPVDISVETLGQQPLHLEGVTITVVRQRYDNRVQTIECRFDLNDPLSQTDIQHRQRIERALQQTLIPEGLRTAGMFEEYVVLLIKDTGGVAPDQFINNNAQNFARFIRSQRESFDDMEIEEILGSRVRYSKEDLTLVDWEGAIIIAPAGDFQSDIELFKVGNYQLLRYRIIDQTIEANLHEINTLFKQRARGFFGLTRNAVKRIVDHRLELMVDFEHTAQNLLLIGDWYTAKLYTVIRDEFYLDNWKTAVQEKLDNLEDIVSTIQENFSLTWSGLLDAIQLAGWIILLIGYFVLFFIDMGFFQK